ncbi:MAG: S41 family peptidase [Bdellovibrionaceae bacterium]|nr:S41 family peptidase [Pseudobdellovibrionaceae bacterium]
MKSATSNGIAKYLKFGVGAAVLIGGLAVFAQERYTDLQNFAKILNLVQQYYVEPVDSKKLMLGAIRGMLRELDPHTSYMPQEVFKDFETETSGEFGGLGIEISIQNGILTIISPIEDTPAWEAGIKPGDRVVAVDGKSTKGLGLMEASQLMRGKRGSKTVLTVVREKEDEPRDIAIVRGSVKIRSVKPTDLGEGYHYFRVTSFIENTGRDLEKYMAEAVKKAGKDGVKGIVMDLRRNPGGLLDQAIKISDMFLKEGDIVSTIGRDPKQKEVVSATKKGKYTEFPIIILVNEYSASASEIVAGALQDNKRAIVMGARSFGKGSVQHVIKLGDGSGLKLTIARYFTPSGRSIQAEGIQPDIELEEVDAEAFGKAVVKSKGGNREKDIAGHLLGEKEKAAKIAELKEKKQTEQDKSDIASGWWKAEAKEIEKMSPRDKLLASDYQVFQAYNYLKAWKIMRGVSK